MAPPPVDYSIYFVTGRELVPAGQTYLANLEAALQGGVTIVQVREKDVSTREFLQIAKDSKAVCDKVSKTTGGRVTGQVGKAADSRLVARARARLRCPVLTSPFE